MIHILDSPCRIISASDSLPSDISRPVYWILWKPGKSCPSGVKAWEWFSTVIMFYTFEYTQLFRNQRFFVPKLSHIREDIRQALVCFRTAFWRLTAALKKQLLFEEWRGFPVHWRGTQKSVRNNKQLVRSHSQLIANWVTVKLSWIRPKLSGFEETRNT